MSWVVAAFATLLGVQETLVERVVAVVGDQVITLTEVEETARVIWIAQGGTPKSVDSVPATVRDTVLGYLIDQAVIGQFVVRYGYEDASKFSRDAKLQSFVDKFESRDAYEAFMRRFQIDEDEVVRLFKRQGRNEAFLRERGRLRLLAAGSSIDSSALQSAMDDAFVEMKAQLKIVRSEVTGR